MSWRQKATIVSVDEKMIVAFATPSLAKPWVICALRDSAPPVVVTQTALRRGAFETDVFVDGRSVDSGESLEEWRDRQPEPMDRFQQEFDNAFFGPAGAVVFGAIPSVFVVAQFAREPNVMWGAASLASFFVPFAWFLVVAALARWLIHKPEWPAAVRRGMVAFVLLGVPCLLVLVLQVLLIR